MLRLALAISVVFFAVGQSSAQVRRGGSRYSRPTLSPYLNLLRNDRSTAFNYQLRVRPQLDFQRQLNRQSRGLQSLERGLAETQQQFLQSSTSRLSPTGNVATFQDLRGYFPQARAAGAAGGVR